MSLLKQAIQEYLKDNHPEWHTLTPNERMIYITHVETENYGEYIKICMDQQTITAVPRSTARALVVAQYVEHTVMQQIAKAIDYIGQL